MKKGSLIRTYMQGRKNDNWGESAAGTKRAELAGRDTEVQKRSKCLGNGTSAKRRVDWGR